MIVWGGHDSLGFFRTGGIYDPATNTWTATNTAGAPYGESARAGVWTGSRMIVWGGNAGASLVNGGWIYDPATDSWTATSTTNAPPGRIEHTAVWTGSRMIVWGGYDAISPVHPVDTGGIYDLATDTWTATSPTGAPTPRFYHTALWTGSRMIVWGGYGSSYFNSGGIYDPATNTWTATSTTDAPAPRSSHVAVWTQLKMVIWGGRDNDRGFDTGGIYDDRALLPPPTDFYTVTPCRATDTRNPAGPTGGPALGGGSTRRFPVTGAACGIPSTARAVSVNLTAVEPETRGNLTLYPGDGDGPPLASHINFTPGVTRANNAVVPLATDGTGTIKVRNGSAGAVHFVLDVNGYFQ
jgi:hypothetical protein